MRNKILLIVISVIVIAGVAVTVSIMLIGGDSKYTGEMQLSINVQEARSVGSISFELKYDPSVIEVVSVTLGQIANNSMVEYNIETPGQVIIGVIDSSGIKGSGDLINLGFNILDKQGVTSLSIENVKAHDAESLIDVVAETTDGKVDATDESISSPSIRFK